MSTIPTPRTDAEVKLVGVGLCRALERENTTLRAQLPEDMQDCTIRFKSCRKGHGWLTATNWVQHGCPTCERDKLRAALEDIATIAHCIAKAGPLNTPTLADAWRKFMRISAKAKTAARIETKS